MVLCLQAPHTPHTRRRPWGLLVMKSTQAHSALHGAGSRLVSNPAMHVNDEWRGSACTLVLAGAPFPSKSPSPRLLLLSGSLCLLRAHPSSFCNDIFLIQSFSPRCLPRSLLLLTLFSYFFAPARGLSCFLFFFFAQYLSSFVSPLVTTLVACPSLPSLASSSYIKAHNLPLLSLHV